MEGSSGESTPVATQFRLPGHEFEPCTSRHFDSGSITPTDSPLISKGNDELTPNGKSGSPNFPSNARSANGSLSSGVATMSSGDDPQKSDEDSPHPMTPSSKRPVIIDDGQQPCSSAQAAAMDEQERLQREHLPVKRKDTVESEITFSSNERPTSSAIGNADEATTGSSRTGPTPACDKDNDKPDDELFVPLFPRNQKQCKFSIPASAVPLDLVRKFARHKVSQQRRRYREDITDRIIAMGYPSDGMEMNYRNSMEEVRHFLNSRHKGHYYVFNLRTNHYYDKSKFDYRVVTYDIDDHHPPALEIMLPFCQQVEDCLRDDPANVVAIHCKAGKGRTGVMICAFLVHIGLMNSPRAILDYYSLQRTINNQGVTIPSQRRYIYYYHHLRKKNINYLPLRVELTGVFFECPPWEGFYRAKIFNGDILLYVTDELEVKPSDVALLHEAIKQNQKAIKEWKKDPRGECPKVMSLIGGQRYCRNRAPNRPYLSREAYGWRFNTALGHLCDDRRIFLEGDIKIVFEYRKRSRFPTSFKEFGHIWFNTAFSCPYYSLGPYDHGDKVEYKLETAPANPEHQSLKYVPYYRPRDLDVGEPLKPVPPGHPERHDGVVLNEEIMAELPHYYPPRPREPEPPSRDKWAYMVGQSILEEYWEDECKRAYQPDSKVREKYKEALLLREKEVKEYRRTGNPDNIGLTPLPTLPEPLEPTPTLQYEQKSKIMSEVRPFVVEGPNYVLVPANIHRHSRIEHLHLLNRHRPPQRERLHENLADADAKVNEFYAARTIDFDDISMYPEPDEELSDGEDMVVDQPPRKMLQRLANQCCMDPRLWDLGVEDLPGTSRIPADRWKKKLEEDSSSDDQKPATLASVTLLNKVRTRTPVLEHIRRSEDAPLMDLYEHTKIDRILNDDAYRHQQATRLENRPYIVKPVRLGPLYSDGLEREQGEHVQYYDRYEVDKVHKNKDIPDQFRIFVTTRCPSTKDDDMLAFNYVTQTHRQQSSQDIDRFGEHWKKGIIHRKEELEHEYAYRRYYPASPPGNIKKVLPDLTYESVQLFETFAKRTAVDSENTYRLIRIKDEWSRLSRELETLKDHIERRLAVIAETAGQLVGPHDWNEHISLKWNECRDLVNQRLSECIPVEQRPSQTPPIVSWYNLVGGYRRKRHGFTQMVTPSNMTRQLQLEFVGRAFITSTEWEFILNDPHDKYGVYLFEESRINDFLFIWRALRMLTWTETPFKPYLNYMELPALKLKHDYDYVLPTLMGPSDIRIFGRYYRKYFYPVRRDVLEKLWTRGWHYHCEDGIGKYPRFWVGSSTDSEAPERQCILCRAMVNFNPALVNLRFIWCMNKQAFTFDSTWTSILDDFRLDTELDDVDVRYRWSELTEVADVEREQLIRPGNMTIHSGCLHLCMASTERRMRAYNILTQKAYDEISRPGNEILGVVDMIAGFVANNIVKKGHDFFMSLPSDDKEKAEQRRVHNMKAPKVTINPPSSGEESKTSETPEVPETIVQEPPRTPPRPMHLLTVPRMRKGSASSMPRRPRSAVASSAQFPRPIELHERQRRYTTSPIEPRRRDSRLMYFDLPIQVKLFEKDPPPPPPPVVDPNAPPAVGTPFWKPQSPATPTPPVEMGGPFSAFRTPVTRIIREILRPGNYYPPRKPPVPPPSAPVVYRKLGKTGSSVSLPFTPASFAKSPPIASSSTGAKPSSSTGAKPSSSKGAKPPAAPVPSTPKKHPPLRPSSKTRYGTMAERELIKLSALLPLGPPTSAHHLERHSKKLQHLTPIVSLDDPETDPGKAPDQSGGPGPSAGHDQADGSEGQPQESGSAASQGTGQADKAPAENTGSTSDQPTTSQPPASTSTTSGAPSSSSSSSTAPTQLQPTNVVTVCNVYAPPPDVDDEYDASPEMSSNPSREMSSEPSQERQLEPPQPQVEPKTALKSLKQQQFQLIRSPAVVEEPDVHSQSEPPRVRERVRMWESQKSQDSSSSANTTPRGGRSLVRQQHVDEAEPPSTAQPQQPEPSVDRPSTSKTPQPPSIQHPIPVIKTPQLLSVDSQKRAPFRAARPPLKLELPKPKVTGGPASTSSGAPTSSAANSQSSSDVEGQQRACRKTSFDQGYITDPNARRLADVSRRLQQGIRSSQANPNPLIPLRIKTDLPTASVPMRFGGQSQSTTAKKRSLLHQQQAVEESPSSRSDSVDTAISGGSSIMSSRQQSSEPSEARAPLAPAETLESDSEDVTLTTMSDEFTGGQSSQEAEVVSSSGASDSFVTPLSTPVPKSLTVEGPDEPSAIQERTPTVSVEKHDEKEPDAPKQEQSSKEQTPAKTGNSHPKAPCSTTAGPSTSSKPEDKEEEKSSGDAETSKASEPPSKRKK